MTIDWKALEAEAGTPELLPCPFCGGKAEMYKGGVFCLSMDCCAYHKLRRVKPREWNTRADLEAYALRAKRQLEAAEELAGCVRALLKLDDDLGTRSTVHEVTNDALAAYVAAKGGDA